MLPITILGRLRVTPWLIILVDRVVLADLPDARYPEVSVPPTTLENLANEITADVFPNGHQDVFFHAVEHELKGLSRSMIANHRDGSNLTVYHDAFSRIRS